MKYFVIYTALRILLFAACTAAVGGIVGLFLDDTSQIWIWSLVLGAIISSVLSLKLLEGPRERFAQSVEARASRAAARFDELKSSEDAD